MRVQRTRSSASPPRSPLTRGPLGGTGGIVRILLFCAVLLVSGGIACSTHGTAAGSKETGFGVVNPQSAALNPETLARVSKDQTLGTIFQTLGPAHGSSFAGCSATGGCWEWHFTNGTVLVIPIDTDPEAKPKSFQTWMVDGAA
jgi:hypothetical protein